MKFEKQPMPCKRVRMKITTRKGARAVTPICGGVSLGKDGRFSFDWRFDEDSDILMLETDTSGTFDNDGVCYVYGYEYNPRADVDQIKELRDALKSNNIWNNKIFNGYVEDFVEDGVCRLDSYTPIRDFALVVDIESSSRILLGEISSRLCEFNRNFETLTLIKQMYADIQFDYDSACAAMLAAGFPQSRIDKEIAYNLNKFDRLKNSGEMFKLKRYVPKEIREGFFDFLKFSSEADKELYLSLQGVNVLIYDDFYTSGKTVREVVRILRSIHNENNLTVFNLIKQH